MPPIGCAAVRTAPRLLRALPVPFGLTVLVLVAGSPVGATSPTAASGRCAKPPLTVTVLPGPMGTTGPVDFAVGDAVARRVPIVPQPPDARRDGATLERLEAKAARTDLALYTLYLADFTVPRKELTGFGFGEITAPDGRTVAAVTIVPTEKSGFAQGDTAEVAPFEYESTTTFAPVSFVVNSSGKRSTYAYDGIIGGVEIRRLTDTSICLDVDVAFTRAGQTVASATGTVKAPVVKAAPTFFYT